MADSECVKVFALGVLAVLGIACTGYREVGTATAPVATPTLEASSQRALYPGDSGRTLVYKQATRFTLDLDPVYYPPSGLRLRCSHDRVLQGLTGEDKAVVPRPYVFEARELGECRISVAAFEVTVRVVP
jgi:hypothetical protein